MNIKPQQMEMFVASRLAERLGGNEQLLERILERRNVLRAMNRVIANKGAPGVDTKGLLGLSIVAANMISDIYFRAKAAGAEITPDNIRDHIKALEEKADANDQEMGISQ